MKVSGSKLRSVRIWLTVWNVAVLATVLVGFAVGLRVTISNRISQRVSETTARVAHGIQRAFAEGDMPPFPRSPGGFRGEPTPGSGPDRGPNPYSVFAQFRPSILTLDLKPFDADSHDRLWDKVGFIAASGGIEKYTTINYQHASVRVFSAPLRTNGKIVGVVQVARPLTDVLHTLSFVNYALKRLIPLALLAAGLGGALLTFRALRPVHSDPQAAERIEAENLSGRLPIGGGDEFSELATTFNNVLDRLESAFRGLERSHEQQRRFVGDASHELKTPLTAIKAHASLAMTGERSNEQYKKSMAAIDHAADRMSRIIQDLLILARADDGQLELSPEPIPIAGVIEEAIEAVRQPDSAAIRFVRPNGPLCILGEPDSLMRLFVNLLSNAVRHTPSTGTIKITAFPMGDCVRIRIKDSGRASQRSTCRTSPSGSIEPTLLDRAPMVAAAWAWLSARQSSTHTTVQ